jgi:hypothetical protein
VDASYRNLTLTSFCRKDFKWSHNVYIKVPISFSLPFCHPQLEAVSQNGSQMTTALVRPDDIQRKKRDTLPGSEAWFFRRSQQASLLGSLARAGSLAPS